MKQQKRKNQQRQRQKVSRKTILLVFAASLTFVVGLTIFFNLTHLSPIKASGTNIILVTDQEFITEKNIAAPVIADRPATNASTIFIRKAKSIPERTPVTH